MPAKHNGCRMGYDLLQPFYSFIIRTVWNYCCTVILPVKIGQCTASTGKFPHIDQGGHFPQTQRLIIVSNIRFLPVFCRLEELKFWRRAGFPGVEASILQPSSGILRDYRRSRNRERFPRSSGTDRRALEGNCRGRFRQKLEQHAFQFRWLLLLHQNGPKGFTRRRRKGNSIAPSFPRSQQTHRSSSSSSSQSAFIVIVFNGVDLHLQGMRGQPQPQHHPPLPAGFLLRGREQGLPLLLLRRRLQVPIREGGQDQALLRDPQLLGHPAEADQDHLQLLRPRRRPRLRRRPSDDGQSWAVPHGPEPGDP